MGNSTLKGYRILDVKPNSPFDTKVEPYFDFIVDVITQPSPRQILDKLSSPEPKEPLANMMLKVKENINKLVKFKVFSNKSQTLRVVEVVPNNQWGEKEDLLGIQFRLQDPKLVRSNYCRISDVQIGSPAAKARLVNDEYLIACEEIRYGSIHQLVDSMHEMLYSQQITNKNVTFITYNVFTDELSSHKVELVRKWGGKGIVGCQFLEGHIYRFPDNLEQIRKRYKEKSAYQKEIRAIQRQMLNNDGVSKRLAQNLKKKAVKRELMFKEPEAYKHDLEKSKSAQQPNFKYYQNVNQSQMANSFAVNQMRMLIEDKFNYFERRLESIERFIMDLCKQQKETVEAVQLLPENQSEIQKTELKAEMVSASDNL